MAKKKGLLKPKEDLSLDECLDKAESLINEYNYPEAGIYCQKALEMNQDEPRALEMAASLFLENSDIENAKHCYGRAIAVNPEEGHAKYMAIAQLFGGIESLEMYKKGIEILSRQIENLKSQNTSENGAAANLDSAKEIKNFSRELSNAFVAMAELFVTDLCDETEAESHCIQAIDNAESSDESNPEAFQIRARYQIVRGLFDEAKDSMRKSLDLWLPRFSAILENKQEIEDFDPVETCPLLYVTRTSTAKILIELEMWDEGVQVLEGMLEEDDQVVETWYLLGWLNWLRANDESSPEEGYKGNARFYLSKAEKTNKSSPTDDQQLIEHITELLTELGPVEETSEEQNAQDDKEWEDLANSESEDEEEEKSQNQKME